MINAHTVQTRIYEQKCAIFNRIYTNRIYEQKCAIFYTQTRIKHRYTTYPKVVIVTIVYQKLAGILVNFVPVSPFST